MSPDQGSLFDLGDGLGDELARRSDDGATWTEPSLFQQGRESTAAELEADTRALALLEEHRALVAERAREAELEEACAAIAEELEQPRPRRALEHCIHCGRVIWRQGESWVTAGGRAGCKRSHRPHEPEGIYP